MPELMPGIAAAPRRSWRRTWADDQRAWDRRGWRSGAGIALGALASLPAWAAIGLLIIRWVG
jgi:hypothetical protein